MRRDVTRIRQALQPIREKPTGKTYIAVCSLYIGQPMYHA